MTAARGSVSSTARRVPVRPVTLASSIRSEWIKLSTLRSTWLGLALATVGTVVVGAAACWDTNNSWDHMPPDELAHFSAIDDSLTGVVVAQLLVAVLGVLVISGEYATGMIRSTLTAAPRRLPVLWAKLAVFAVMIAIAMIVTSFVSFFVGQAFLGSHATTIGAPHALRSVIGSAAYLTAISIFAVAIGFVVRSVAGGIASVVAILLVLPGLGAIVPVSWQNHVLPYLPSNAGLSLYAVNSDQPTLLSVPAAIITLVVWCAAAVGLAAVLLRERDA